MTDKEIIINKVSVRACSVYKDGICLISKEKCNAKCDYAAYYLYEQLERKEQECKSLEARVKELEEYKKSKQASYEAMQAKNNNLEWEKRELEKKVKELETIIDRLSKEVNAPYTLDDLISIDKLQRKLKIAEEALQYYADGEDMSEAKMQGSDAWRYVVDDNHTDTAQQALQKIKEIDLNNNSNPKKTIKIFGKEIDEDVARKALQEVLDEIADYEEECKKNGKNIKEVN